MSINAVRAPNGVIWAGYKITKNQFTRTEAFRLGGPGSTVYMGLSYQLILDQEGQYLAVASSFVGLFLDAGMEKLLLHFDYERDKDGYLRLTCRSKPARRIGKSC